MRENELSVAKVLEHAKEELENCEKAIAEIDLPGACVLAWVQEAAVWVELIEWIGQHTAW